MVVRAQIEDGGPAQMEYWLVVRAQMEYPPLHNNFHSTVISNLAIPTIPSKEVTSFDGLIGLARLLLIF